jgi:hypothetical protein
MRSKSSHTISSREVHGWALSWLTNSIGLKDHGWKCTAPVVWNLVLRAAARTSSLFAACRDLADAPSEQALLAALTNGLPKTLRVLEARLNAALTSQMPKRMQRRAWRMAVDWHLVPYYGEPQDSRNEIYLGQPHKGTNKFHAYATVCIVRPGVRYTLALTWVRRHETAVTALRRLLTEIRRKGLKIKCLLMDRAFFSTTVTHFLQTEQVPFLMPVVMRGRVPKRKPFPGLHGIKRQAAGWYPHTLKNKTQAVQVSVCVTYRTVKKGKKAKRKQQKLLFAAWRVHGQPREIRELYRTRFGIETSYRQWRQARIFTCTRDPHLRLLFIGVGLMLRNVWVWIHETRLAEGWGESMILHLERLRFRRMLDWIVYEVVALLHDGSPPYIELSP